MRVISIVAACGLLAGARTAVADGTGVIAAIGAGVTADRQAVAGAMADAIASAPPRAGAPRSPRVVADAVGTARAAQAAGAVPVATMQRFRHVRDAIDAGWRDYVRVAIEPARAQLVAARTEAEGLLALPGGSELYADASLRLGIVLGQLGRADEAHAALALAVALDPDRPVTQAEFAPDVVDAVAAVRAETPATRRVHVAVQPPGARVSVDRVDVGDAPVDADVTRGQHVVVARAPRFHTAAKAVAVSDDSPGIDLALDDDLDAARLDAGARVGLPDEGAAAIVDLTLRYADVDDVVVAIATERRGGPTLIVQRCAGAPARCTAPVEVGYGDARGLPAAARSAWDAVLAGDLRYGPTAFGDQRVADGGPHDGGAHCHVCRSPYLWGGVGAVVIGAIVWIVVDASASRGTPVLGIDPNGFGRH